MASVIFSGSRPRIKQLIIWVMFAELLITFTMGILYYLGGKPQLGYINLLASLAVIFFLLTLTILWIYYLRQPEVKEKYRLMKQIRQNQAELISVEGTFNGILNKKEQIQRLSREHQETEQEKFKNLDNSFQDQINHLKYLKEQEIKAEISRIQKAYLENELKNIPLDPALVPGIGDVLAGKLASDGILTAFDISNESIQRISGFGEAKALSLVRWRESEEYKLIANQPTSLPVEDQTAIEQKYDLQIVDKENEAKSAQSALESSLQVIRSKETAELSALSEKETSSRLELTTLTTLKQGFVDQFKQYSHIAFLGMLSAALTSGSIRWSNRAVSVISLVLFFILGFLDMIIMIGALILSRS